MIAYQSNDEVVLRLKHPLGKLFIGPPEKTIGMLKEEFESKNPTVLFAIGDIVASNILRSNMHVHFIIIDYKSERHPVDPICLNNFKIVNVKNPAGMITTSAYDTLKEICSSLDATAIIVDGEEDLLTLPVIRFAPLGSFVVYGQPFVGIVLVTVTSRVKFEVEQLMNKMHALN